MTLDDLDLHNKPHLIWNLDESGFCLDPSKTKVVGNKGTAASRTTAGAGRENVTVLMAVNAAGHKAPPFIIFKGENIWDEWIASEGQGFPGTTYAATTNGWMESKNFLKYFEKSFFKQIGETRPVLIIYDGHVSHVGERLISSALRNNVTILKLPPHSSHLLQPLDLSVFRSLKTRWDVEVIQWQRHQGYRIPKKHFSRLIGKIWRETQPEIINSGFRKGGIFPFDSKVITSDKYDPLALKRWETHQRNSDLKNNNEHENTQQNDKPGPSTSNHIERDDDSDNLKPDNGTSFEELLLETVKQHKGMTDKKPRRKIAGRAEIITAPEVLKRLQGKEIKKPSKRVSKKLIESETSSDEEVICEDQSDDDIEEEFRDQDELTIFMDELNK